MKILYVLDFEPFCEDKDGLTKIYYNLIKHISKNNDVDLLIVLEDITDDVDNFYGVKNIFYETIKLSKLEKNINRIKYEYATTLSKNKVKILYDKYNMKQYNVIHTAHLFFSNISFYHSSIVIGATDAASLAMSENTLREKLRKFYYKKIEDVLSQKDLWIHTVSQRDEDRYKTDKKFIITNGVDSKKYRLYHLCKIKKSFVFHGNLDYKVNKDAIFYMSKVLKGIDCKYKLYIVGRGESESYALLDNVVVVGEVDNIAKEICKYESYLILMTTGTGVKNKLLEAMSCECNIVANNLAINGLEDIEYLEHSINIIDDCDEIQNITLNKVDKNARDYILKNYTWESFANQFIIRYEKIWESRLLVGKK